jgi:hypothetical protein
MARLLNRCTLAHYIVDPVPSTLAHSLSLYMHFARLDGDIIEYRHDLCPVTRVRLPKLRVMFYDKSRGELPKGELRHLFADGKMQVSHDSLSDLEKDLVDTKCIKLADNLNYGLKMIFMTRKLESMMESRSRQFLNQTDELNVSQDVDREQRLQTFMNVFEKLEKKNIAS